MRKSTLTLLAGLCAGGLVLAGCGDDDGGGETTSDGGGDTTEVQTIGDVETGSCDPAEGNAEMPDPEGTGDDETEITIGVFSGWDENYVVAELAKVALEEQGYTVEFEELEAGPAYTGVAQGDIDVLMDAWLPNTHAQYVEQFGDDLEDAGCWFDEGYLTIAVNADSPAQSLDELADNADAYGSRLVGIEPGAGLTATTQEEVIPTYGLDDWDFPTSSSPAMLAELDNAMSAGDDIAVTLWHPHWAYAAYDIRDLEDPEGALGEAERLYSLARPGFHEDFPNAAQLIQNLYLSNEQLLEIEDIMVVENGREDNAGSVAQWLDANPEFVADWRAGTLL
ncbi:glycine betaine ABC transporter substrate-binding protein [Jiangella asiatica]|uniref:Glycine betaine ABC transporter substrate-binding protein n=1 Tax=Jiangella asiatica TaxID=2530372 RepID=A0A4R5D902_9ACTN|nr:glycine betaine ABC transporter substrate-binding protein [Jiangella asiatica]TDE08221.1 glycine betaine ABC transporter substrate-binding protein [Jiangella asiatica]